MKFTEWGSKRQKSWYRQMRRKERKEYQDANNIGWDFNALFPTAWLSFQPDHLYADVGKTVPATIGGGIASFDDLSGNSVTGPQPVSTARPIMGRVPRTGRRNILSNNNALDTEWSSSGSHVSVQGGATDPFGGNRAFRITINSLAANNVAPLVGSTIAHTLSGKPCVASVWARRVLGPSNIRVYFDGAYPPSVSPTNEWERLEIPFIGGADGGNRFDLRFTGLGSEVDIYLPQLEPGTEATEAQIASSDYDVTEAGIPSVHYAHYALADDVLPHNATLPAITDGTVILIGKDGIWIDEGYSFAGGDWSFGPTGYTDGPEGIIGVVGDMLDLVVLDRPLTADERDRVVAYGVKRGSAGLITVGPELVENTGGPFTESSPFFLSAGMPDTSLDVVDGNLVMSSSGARPAHAMQVVPGGLPVSFYLTELGVVSSDVVGHVRVGVSAVGNPSSVSSNLILSSGQARLGKTRVVGRPSDGIAGSALAIGGRDDVKSLIISSISLRRLIMPGETP